MNGDSSSGAPSNSGPDALEPPAPSPPERYVRQGLIGKGGMGRVYAALDARLRRQVALKVAATPELASRLAREAWITAQLEHPNIVAVYDTGETDGQAWYTMRMIRGRTLRERLGSCPDLAARIELLPHLHTACQAVAYAHSMGIVHRDLKPSNIMVGEFGETQVADWGLAIPLAEAQADWARLVAHPGEVAGTPRYMSPEAAQGGPASRGSDVFALGAALWELLAGKPPPDPPQGPLALAPLPDDVPPELAAVVRRALQPDPQDRYPSAEELADDLGRWLSGARVRAHEYRPSELLVRLLRAWRVPLAVAGVALLVLLTAAIFAVRRIDHERELAEASLAVALSETALSALLDERLPEAHQLAAHALSLGPSAEARGILAAARPGGVQLLSSTPLPANCRRNAVVSPDGTSLACPTADTLELWTVSPLSLRVALPVAVGGDPVWMGSRLLISTTEGLVWVENDALGARVPDGPWQALASEEQAFAVRGPDALALAPSGSAVRFPICLASPVTKTVVGSQLVVGCLDGQARSYDVTGAERSAVPIGPAPGWSTVLAQSNRLLVGRLDGGVHTVDPTTGASSAPLRGPSGGVLDLQAVPGTGVVLVLGERGGPRLWNTHANVWAGALPAGAGRMFPGSAPGEVWLVGESLERWSIPAEPQPHVLSFSTGVSQVAPSPSGDALAVALGSGDVVERRRADGASLRRWRWTEGVAKCVAYSGTEQLFAGAMGAPGQWLSGNDTHTRLASDGLYRRAGSLTRGRVWALDYGGFAHVLTPDGGAAPRTATAQGALDGSSSPDGETAVVLDSVGDVWRLLDTGWSVVAKAQDAVAIDVGNGGSPVVSGGARRVCIGANCVDVPGDVVDLAVSRELVAVSTLGGDVVLLSLSTGERIAVLRGHTARVSSVEFGPDGTWLASGSWDATVRLWDLTALDEPAEMAVARGESAWGLTLDAARRAH